MVSHLVYYDNLFIFYLYSHLITKFGKNLHEMIQIFYYKMGRLLQNALVHFKRK